MSKAPEILAPAGGRETFFAALNAGADAVYLGLQDFNARATADNFTADDLAELVPVAHRFGMRVLVTVNTLVKERELPRVVSMLSTLDELAVDGIIVQDLGIARLSRQAFPALLQLRRGLLGNVVGDRRGHEDRVGPPARLVQRGPHLLGRLHVDPLDAVRRGERDRAADQRHRSAPRGRGGGQRKAHPAR